jgi:adenylylsulfate kinase
MEKKAKNIFPVFDQMIQRKEKEMLLFQHAVAIWIYGLSGSGKTTLAIELDKILFSRGLICNLLDADNIRTGLNNDLDFSIKQREENIRRVAEINKLFIDCGVITINCFVCPTIAMRTMAKKIIGKKDFVEIFLNAPFEICHQRDTKGLYKKANQGKISEFTGISSPFEKPAKPDLEVRTDILSIKDSVNKILEFVLPKIELK